MLVLREFGSRENFTKVCSPMAQLVVGRDPKRAILSERSPSLLVMKKAYGDNFPVAWLMEQILELGHGNSEFPAGRRRSGSPGGARFRGGCMAARASALGMV